MDYCSTQHIKTSQQILSQFVSIESHERNLQRKLLMTVRREPLVYNSYPESIMCEPIQQLNCVLGCRHERKHFKYPCGIFVLFLVLGHNVRRATTSSKF